ncbi:MAG: hypothetical protein H7Z73_03865 [Candidatus Saccharibacteria bacterium]|nr:hypothetical protein [Moraxellaceae bacterium]
MLKYIFLFFLTNTCFALQPLADAALGSANVAKEINTPKQSSDLAKSTESPIIKIYLTDEQRQFRQDLEKNTGKLYAIYKEQIKKHSLPDRECIRFNFRIERTGVVKTIEADKKDISVENAELISNIINMFEKSLFSSRSSDYSETQKFCLWF